MKEVGIGALPRELRSEAKSKNDFANMVVNSTDGQNPAVSQPPLAGPGVASVSSIRSMASTGTAMPDDADFMIVEDVSIEATAYGDEIATVSGTTATAAQADEAAVKDGAMILSLPEPRHANRSISGSMFASMLLDQRNGILPNPFSLMRLPEPPAAPTHAAPVQGAEVLPPVAPIAGPETQGHLLPDAPGEDALAVSKEISRMEATIALLIQKLTDMLKTLRVMVGMSARKQSEAVSQPMTDEATRQKR